MEENTNLKKYLYEVANSDNGVLVSAKDTRSPEEIQQDAISEIREITGFESKIYKSNEISNNYFIKLKKLGLSPREGHRIFLDFLAENSEKPVRRVHDKFDDLIYEYIHGIEKGICPDCGEELLKHANYCTYCGEKITSRYAI